MILSAEFIQVSVIITLLFIYIVSDIKSYLRDDYDPYLFMKSKYIGKNTKGKILSFVGFMCFFLCFHYLSSEIKRLVFAILIIAIMATKNTLTFLWFRKASEKSVILWTLFVNIIALFLLQTIITGC